MICCKKIFFGIILSSGFFLLETHPVFASSLLNHSYTYDKVGNILSIRDSLDNSKTLNYSYDKVYRLQGASGGYTASYTYDTDGNILTKTEGSTALTEGYYPSDTSTHAPKVVNGKSLTYDTNGNLTEDQYSNLKISYDYENRPIRIESAVSGKPSVTKYYYDGEGKRIKKEVYDTTNPSSPILKTTTYYINQYYEREVPVGGTPKIRKFYSGVAYREGDTLSFTTSDHLASTTLLTNRQGQKTNDYRYYPYGSPITPSSPLPPNSWIGQKLDTETNLYFLNARYYSPTTGRFVQKDIANDPTGRGNGYMYARNNPVAGKDSNGAFCDYGEFCLGVFAGAVWSGIADSAGRMSTDAQFYFNNYSNPRLGPEKIAAIADFVTLGQASRTVESWNRNWPTISNSNLSFPERLPAAIDAGVNITGLSAAVVPAGVFASKVSSVDNPNVLGALAKRMARLNPDEPLGIPEMIKGEFQPYAGFTAGERVQGQLAHGLSSNNLTPAQQAGELAMWGMRNRRFNGVGDLLPHNAYRRMIAGNASCVDCTQVLSSIFGATPFNYSTGLLPHYGSIFQEGYLVFSPSDYKIYSEFIMMRFVSK